MKPVLIFVLFAIVHVMASIKTSSNNVNHWKEKVVTVEHDDDCGEPLFLTPFIQDGRLEEAKSLSRTGFTNQTDIESYSGYLTVNQKYNSNMFFIYILAKNNAPTAPVVLWLQGGPGASDQLSLFFETGPVYVDENLQLKPRNYSWNTNFNMLYIDNPVGTGFSFTDFYDGYARNETTVAHDLYEALTQILTLFEEHQNNEFYVTGQSYAGKYVPSIAYLIFLRNKQASLKINLKGIAIGNAFIDPVTMNNYGDYLNNLGLIDVQTRLIYIEYQNQLVQLIERGKFKEAFYIFDFLMNGDFTSQTLFTNVTGFDNYYNFLYTSSNINQSPAFRFLDSPRVHKAIHVGNRSNNNDGFTVEFFLIDDFMNSTKPHLETLLDNGLKTILYSGQLDIILPYVFTENMINSMTWKKALQFRNAPRIIWKVDPNDTDIAGYAKQLDNFSFVLIRNAGHLAPHDQPRSSFDLISRFVAGKPFT